MSYLTKEWNWERNNDDYWLVPEDEIFYLCERWRNRGFVKFLDLGCGLGRHSVFMAKQGYDVTAADLSDFAINHTQTWAKREKCSIKAVKADFTKLPFDDNSFDCIIAYNVIYHSDTLVFTAAVDEIRRVLKPDGEIFLTLLSKNTHSRQIRSDYEQKDADTLIRNNSNSLRKRVAQTENDVPHLYVGYDDIIKYFRGWDFVKLPREWTDYSLEDKNRFSTHWSLLLRK